MAQSVLRQVLTIFETAQAPLSLPQIARDLGVSTARLEAMIQHWVRKGKIRERGGAGPCGGCSKSDTCAFVLEMPRTYELAVGTDSSSPEVVATGCVCGCVISKFEAR